MQKRVVSGFMSALMISSLSLVPASRAEEVADSQKPPAAKTATMALQANLSSSTAHQAVAVNQAAQTQTAEVVKVGSTEDGAPSDQLKPFATVRPFVIKDRQAAILYVRNLPLLTFFGDRLFPAQTPANTQTGGDRKLPGTDQSQPEEPEASSPLSEASVVAARLNQLNQASADGRQITARWDRRQNAYVIAHNNQPIVMLNRSVTLADGRGQTRQDTLQATNRLRRFLGGAAPLAALGDGQDALGLLGNVIARSSGMASWYGPGFHGRRSANGEVFNQYALTAAHRSLPFGTRVRVISLATGAAVVVRINDRGPFHGNRVIDLSKGAARLIGLTGQGVGPVRLEILGRNGSNS
jgi:rare lipoprotein A